LRTAASQEIPRILWNPKVHYHIHKIPRPVLILSQINPIHAPILLLEVPFLYYLPIYAWVFQVVSSLRTPHQNPVWSSPLPSTCYMPCQSHFLFRHPNNIRWGVQIIKLLVM
jgi:hypothetical protein